MCQNVTTQHGLPAAATAGSYLLATISYCLGLDIKGFLVIVLLLGWARHSANGLVMRLDSFCLQLSILLTYDLISFKENVVCI